MKPPEIIARLEETNRIISELMADKGVSPFDEYNELQDASDLLSRMASRIKIITFEPCPDCEYGQCVLGAGGGYYPVNCPEGER